MSIFNGEDDRANALRTVVFCVLAELCEGIDLQAAGVAAPGIVSEFHPSPAQLGNFLSASPFGLFVGALIGGRLADRIGRKGVLIVSIGLFGLCSLLTPVAFDMPTLEVARLLTGLGLGGALPNLIALTSESSQPNRRDANVALMYSAAPFGGAIASWVMMVMGGSHWRSVFFVGGVVPLLLVPLMAIALPESAAFRRAQSSPARVRGRFSEIFAEGRTPSTLLLWSSFFLGLLMLYALLNWLPILLKGVGLTGEQASGAQIGFNIGGGCAALLIGHLLEGRWRRPSIVIAFVALPVLVLLLAQSPPQVVPVSVLVLLLGSAVIAAQAFLYATAPALYPTAIRASGVGAAVAVGRIGSIVGPKLAGVLKGMGHSSSQMLIDLLPIVIIGSLCALWLAWLAPKREDARE
jgi:MFS transporter, AAHS family, 3-hydroxyphenylpropionic acid transporter